MNTPAGLGAFLGSLLAGAATVALAGVEWLTTLLGVFGLVWLVVSYGIADERAATVGAIPLFLAVIVAATLGVDPLTVVVGGAGTFLAWTFARTAADLRDDMGRAPTAELELTHVAGTGLLAGAGIVVTYLPFRFGEANLSPLALAMFVVGAVLLTASLREYEE